MNQNLVWTWDSLHSFIDPSTHSLTPQIFTCLVCAKAAPERKPLLASFANSYSRPLSLAHFSLTVEARREKNYFLSLLYISGRPSSSQWPIKGKSTGESSDKDTIFWGKESLAPFSCCEWGGDAWSWGRQLTTSRWQAWGRNIHTEEGKTKRQFWSSMTPQSRYHRP